MYKYWKRRMWTNAKNRFNEQNTFNSRNLEEISDLKDIPVALCLFEMTDNDVIMSISCPESLSKAIKDTMVLDLYFYKPPSIQRPNKDKGNININVEQKDDKIYIRDKMTVLNWGDGCGKIIYFIPKICIKV